MMNVDIPELVPMDDYDARQAKLESSMRWLLTKASGDAIPSEYHEAFFAIGLSSVIAPRLASSELYWAAAAEMFPEVKSHAQQGHVPLIQFLMRRGVYLADVNGIEVNEELLQRTSPLHLMAHITLLEGLMKAYINSVLTVEKVVQAVRRFSTFSASSELPTGTEDAAVFWVNKVCAAICQHLRKSNQPGCPEALALSDIKDLNDGRCLLALVSFYCPQELPLSVLQLDDHLAIADSLYNLQLFHNFCLSHFPASLLTLTVMDLFYTPETIQLNLLVFFADLFRCLEVERASFVRDTGQPLMPALTPAAAAAAEPEPPKMPGVPQPSPKPSRFVIPQISETTKRSFHNSVLANQTRPQSSTSVARQPLLPRRQSDIRSADVSASNVRHPPAEAWTQNNGVPSSSDKGAAAESSNSATSLLSNVMLDVSVNLNALGDSLQSSDDGLTNRAEVLSRDGDSQSKVTNTQTALQSPSCGELLNSALSTLSDRLLPAQLRPSKEKSNNHSKTCEYSERGDRKKHSATTPDENDCERQDTRGEASSGSSSSSTPSDGYKTPSVEGIMDDGVELKDKENAFQYDDSTSNELKDSAECGTFDRNRLGGQSYVVQGRPARFEDAIAAGLPVVGGGKMVEIPRGTTSGYGSSNDGSDQELHKLRADYRDKEFKGSNGNRGFFVSTETSGPPYTSAKPPVDKRVGFDMSLPLNSASKTSFAQIKKQKEVDEVSKAVPDPVAVHEGILGNTSKGIPLLPRPRKKATFGALPNQTTWIQESAQRVAENSVNRTGEEMVMPMPSELIGLRMKLEENRRQIENRKRLAERQWNQQRQQMGKEAFIQVISKNKSGSDVSGDEKSSTTEEAFESFSESSHKMTDSSTSVGESRARDNDLDKSQSEVSVAYKIPLEPRLSESNHDQGNGFLKDDVNSRKRINEQIRGSSMRGRSAERNDVFDKVGEEQVPQVAQTGREESVKYDTSLNRINSSLTELQGEILRLALQQDQINNLVRSDLSQGGRISSTAAVQGLQGTPVLQGHQTSQGSRLVHGAVTPTKEDFYMQPGLTASPLPPGVQSIFHSETPLHQSRPTAVPYSVPSYPPLATSYPQRYNPTPSLPLAMSHYQQPYSTPPPVSVPTDGMYVPPEVGHQFAPLGTQFHPSSGMYPMVPGMYPVSVPTSYHSQFQNTVPHQQYPHLQNLSTLVPRPDYAAGFSPQRMQFAHSSFTSQPPVPPSGFYPPHWPGTEPLQVTPHSTAYPSEVPNPEYNGSSIPVQMTLETIDDGEVKNTPGISPLPQLTPSGAVDVGKVEDLPHVGGFFVNLGDSLTPTRQKPTLKQKQKIKLKGSGDEAVVANPLSTFVVSSAATESRMAPLFQAPMETTPEASEPPNNQEASPLVFVIGQSAEKEEDWLEMEKRKQRLCDLQTKRLEEQEMRRERIQRDQERKREQQRVKQEMADQKRAEEKARREAIFQVYLQKKQEKEVVEETPQKPAAPVIRRQRSATLKAAGRPKSQPALPADVTAPEGVTTYHGHSSQDNLTTEGGACKSPASEFPKSSEKMNLLPSRGDQTLGEIPLAFGGLTHRRPPTPEQLARLAQPASDGSESSGSQLAENYTGPKLFVKPSQKSNRHIIINAISHCCLAGSVNNDVKNKVLQEIAKSDAKHFIILFRDAAMQYRGLYTYNPDQEEVHRIHGVGPKVLTDKVMEKFYKYNSGSKKFSEVTSTKHLSATIDAITVLSTIWQKTRTLGTAKKPA